MKEVMKKNWSAIFTIAVAIADVILINLAFVVSIYLRFPDFGDPSRYWRPWLFVNLAFFPLAIGLGVYRGIFKSSVESQKVYLKKLIYYLGLFTMSYLFLIKGSEYSRGVVIIFLMACYIILEFFHSIFNRLNRRLVRHGYGRRNTLIVGCDPTARNFYEQLQTIYGDFYRVHGFLANGNPSKIDPALHDKIIGRYTDVENIIKEKQIDQVFIVSDTMLQKKYEPIRLVCENCSVKVKMVSPMIKTLMHQLKVRDITGVPLTTESYRRVHRAWMHRSKRLFDMLFLLLSSVIILPVGLVLALLVKFTSRGPVLFRQNRSLYKGGPAFSFYKFRTMYEDADGQKDKFLAQNESNGALFKMKDDPRVTPVGRWLRKYSLDELPQFINVLKGEMSIVGPRPLPVKDFELLRNGKVNYDWYTKRGETLPGITGLWQISGRSQLTFEEMCLLDLYYIENQSIFFDLEIMFETLPVVFLGRGAY